jgi:hypothetical protein
VRPALDPTGPFRVDFIGTKNLVAAARAANVKHYVLVTSIGADDLFFPLNLAWGVLFWKKRGEEGACVRQSARNSKTHAHASQAHPQAHRKLLRVRLPCL